MQNATTTVLNKMNKLKISSSTLKQFVENEGRKYVIQVWDKIGEHWLIFCICCFGSGATFASKNPFADGIVVTDDEYESKDYFTNFKKRLNNHFNDSPTNHNIAMEIVKNNRSKEMASILNKADMIYSILKRG